MRKILFSLSAAVLVAVLICSLALAAKAHPGGTDGKGGHTNSSTGEYHYHHGYTAHQHYDMDGDGVEDCPYDFKDNTDHNYVRSTSSAAQTSDAAQPVVKKKDYGDLKLALVVATVLGLIYYGLRHLISKLS